MEPQTTEKRIRDRAFQLWQRHDALEGRADEYCHQARQLIEREITEDEGKTLQPDV